MARYLLLTPALFFIGCAARIAAAPEDSIEVIKPEFTAPAMASGKQPLTLIWIVSPNRSASDTAMALEVLMNKGGKSFLLTAALPVEMISSLSVEHHSEISGLVGSGRLELAALPAGSLPLPVLLDMRSSLSALWGLSKEETQGAPSRILSRIEMQRLLVRTEEAWAKAMPGIALPGLAAPLGAWPAAAASATRSFSWVLTASSAPFTGYVEEPNGARRRYSATAITPHMDLKLLQGIRVVDEAYPLTLDQAMEILTQMAELNADNNAHWETAPMTYWPAASSAAAPSAVSLQQQAASWAGAQALSPIWGSTAQRRYWALMAELHEDIARYQNSGKAGVETMDRLWEDFFSLLSYFHARSFSKEFMMAPSTANLEREFLDLIGALYQKMAPVLRKKPQLPSSLWQDQGPGRSETGTDVAGVYQQVELFDSFDLPRATGAATGPDLTKFSARWNDKTLTLIIEARWPEENSVTAAVYIDLNHAPYIGRESSLDEVMRAAPVDFWEYSLQLDSGGGAVLFRPAPNGKLLEVGRLQQNSVQIGPSEIRIEIPRSWISGKNPSRWGWGVCLTATAAGQEGVADCLQNGPSDPGILVFLRGQ